MTTRSVIDGWSTCGIWGEGGMLWNVSGRGGVVSCSRDLAIGHNVMTFSFVFTTSDATKNIINKKIYKETKYVELGSI